MTPEDEATIREIGARIAALPRVERATCEEAIKQITMIVRRDGLPGRLALAMVGACVAAAE